jgi:hypothetical protein
MNGRNHAARSPLRDPHLWKKPGFHDGGYLGVCARCWRERRAVQCHQREVLKPLPGLVIGLAGALAVTLVLTNFLFGVKPIDLATFAAVSVLLGAVALLAHPMIALRYE